MGFHTFDPEMVDRLEDPTRFRFCSREELLQYLPRDGTLLDLGSGSGFYTDELAPFFEKVYALDLQMAMHERYRERGVPENVHPVVGTADSLPIATASVDGVVSTMTYHESASEQSAMDLHRVLTPEGSLVVVDWSRAGQGKAGPPRTERHDAATARAHLEDAGFVVSHATERGETFHLCAHPS